MYDPRGTRYDLLGWRTLVLTSFRTPAVFGVAAKRPLSDYHSHISMSREIFSGRPGHKRVVRRHTIFAGLFCGRGGLYQLFFLPVFLPAA